MKRYILFFDGSASNYHAMAFDGREPDAIQMAKNISTLYNVPVYVYETQARPLVIREIHEQHDTERKAS